MITFNEATRKQSIDTRQELSAVAQLLVASWDIQPAQSIRLVDTVYQQTSNIAGAWFKRFEVNRAIGRCQSARLAHVEKEFSLQSQKDLITLYDTVCLQLSAMDMGLWDMEDASTGALVGGHWVFDSEVNRVVRSISPSMPFIDCAKPVGWERHIKDYEDFGMMDEVDEAALAGQFQGHDLSSIGSFALPIALSLPHVLYGHCCQGRSTQGVLIGSIMSHCIGLISHNNTTSMCRELDEITEGFTDGKILPGMRFSEKLSFKHPVLWALDEGSKKNNLARDSAKKKVNSVTEYLKVAKGVEQAASRTGADRKSKREVADEIIERIMQRSQSGALEQERLERKQTYRELIRQSLSSHRCEGPTLK